jgi:hypothetical protein
MAFSPFFMDATPLVPALDDLAEAEAELEGIAAIDAAVELGAVEEGAGVVDHDLVALLGAFIAEALGEDLLGHAAVLGGGHVRLLVDAEIGVLNLILVVELDATHGHAGVRGPSSRPRLGGRTL